MIKRHLRVFNLVLPGVLTLAAAATATAQTYFNGDHNIILPKSGIERPGHRHTLYLIHKTTAAAPSTAERIFHEPTFGPSPQAEGGAGYTPNDIHAAYNIPFGLGTGAIAIVDAFGLSTAQADFNAFCQQYGLPQETSTSITASSNKVLQFVYETPGTAPATDDTGWGGEIALDIEWAHAMAPNAKIYLVLANSDSDPDLDAAVQIAATLPGVKEVSMSWGSGEYPEELSEDSFFQQPGIVYFASAGDVGGVQSYPSESPNVVSVGGTSLTAGVFGYLGETAWADSGGGPSSYEPKPNWQQGISHILGITRGDPDVSAVADPYTGVWVYSKSAYGGSGWTPIGGTSLACPVVAAITNDRGTWTHSTGREEERIYFNLGGAYYRDVTSGTAGSFQASTGWDYITGIGTPDGIFPPYIPPESLQARFCGVYAGVGTANISNSHQSQLLAAVANQDGVLYSVRSSPTSLGQSAALQMNFVMDKSLTVLNSAPVSIYGKAPAGATLQVFALDYDPTSANYNQYVYTGYSAPASGGYANLNFPLQPAYIQAGTGKVGLIVRSIMPPHISTQPYTYSVDRVVLNEVTVPPWDINAPL